MNYPFKLTWSKPKLGDDRYVALSATFGPFGFNMTMKLGEKTETTIRTRIIGGRAYDFNLFVEFLAGVTPDQDTVRFEIEVATPHDEDPELVKVKIRNGRRVVSFTPAIYSDSSSDAGFYTGIVRLTRPA